MLIRTAAPAGRPNVMASIGSSCSTVYPAYWTPIQKFTSVMASHRDEGVGCHGKNTALGGPETDKQQEQAQQRKSACGYHNGMHKQSS